MLKHIKNLKRSRTNPHIILNAPSQKIVRSGVDSWLDRIASLSQLGLLILAVFGYFYTVIPVYEKALLDEEIAKKTLELESMEKNLLIKDSELKEKTSELANLNGDVAQAKQKLNRSQAEVGNLRGKVRNQYSELRPRLVNEFKALTRSICKLDILANESFSDCVQNKVLPTINLAALNEADRKRLLQLVKNENVSIAESLRNFNIEIDKLQTEAEQYKTETLAKCEQERASEDYKDRTKKIFINYQCETGAIKISSKFTKIQMEKLFASEKILDPVLTNIAIKFFAVDDTQ